MIQPAWLAQVLAAVVLAVALFSAARLAVSRRRRWQGELDADVTHLLMGIAMAGMLVSRLAIVPSWAWRIVFAAGASWFAWRVGERRRDRRASGAAAAGPPTVGRYRCALPLPHLIDCLAMLYMLWAVPAIAAAAAPAAGQGMSMAGGAGGARLPVVGLALAVCVCAYIVWLGDRIQAFAPGRAVPAGPALAMGTPAVSSPLVAPRAATCCKIAMGVAMGVMLIDLL